MSKILLVEDDAAMSESLEALLRAERYTVDVAIDGLTALEFLRSYEYDLVILDWQLPGMSGIDVCENYRLGGGMAFILMLTGQNTVEQKERGLDTGADDYLTKPFATRELMARIRALLRRPPSVTSEVLRMGTVEIDTRAKEVRVNNSPVKLMPLEFSLLEFLARHPNEVFSCETLLKRVWGADSDVSLDSVYSCMNRLRKKLQPRSSCEMIQTVHAVGYKFVPPAS